MESLSTPLKLGIDILDSQLGEVLGEGGQG